MHMKVTPQVFNAVKTLTDQGINREKAAKLFGLSTATAWFIDTSGSHEEYKARIREKTQKRRETIQASTAASVDRLDLVEEYLEAIQKLVAQMRQEAA